VGSKQFVMIQIVRKKEKMNKLATLLAIIMTIATFKVHYSIHGSGRDVIVQAESSYDARRMVEDMFPSATVTGVWKTK